MTPSFCVFKSPTSTVTRRRLEIKNKPAGDTSTASHSQYRPTAAPSRAYSQVVCKWQSGAAWEQSKHDFSFKRRQQSRSEAQTGAGTSLLRQSKRYRGENGSPLRPAEPNSCRYEFLNQLGNMLKNTFIVMLYPRYNSERWTLTIICTSAERNLP